MMLTSDIVRVALAGGGLRVDCEKHLVSDLVRIAIAASDGGGQIFLENTSKLLTSDKVRIATASKGHVVFNDLV